LIPARRPLRFAEWELCKRLPTSCTQRLADGLSFQPSAAAVTAIHAGVAGASGVLTERTLITAVKTAAAATAYTENEATSATMLNALSEAL
jgi:hypothetical protein